MAERPRTEQQSNETWRPIKGYRKYEVSSLGRVRNSVRGKLLKPVMTSVGYYQVNLYEDQQARCKHVHRLVAIAFIPNPKNKPQVNHKDGIKANNLASNLEWATQSEQTQHAYDVIGIIPHQRGAFGEKNNASKTVLQIAPTGKIVKTWGAAMDAVRAGGFDSGCISRVCHGENKTHGGFKWRYAA